MKLFLSVSYSSQVDSSGNVLAAYRAELEEIISVLENIGSDVYCAPRQDGWTLNATSPAKALQTDLKHVDNCDVFVAFLRGNVSAGIQLELGYALAMQKRVVIVNSKPNILGYVNQGLVDSARAELISYTSQHELLDKLIAL